MNEEQIRALEREALASASNESSQHQKAGAALAFAAAMQRIAGALERLAQREAQQ